MSLNHSSCRGTKASNKTPEPKHDFKSALNPCWSLDFSGTYWFTCRWRAEDLGQSPSAGGAEHFWSLELYPGKAFDALVILVMITNMSSYLGAMIAFDGLFISWNRWKFKHVVIWISNNQQVTWHHTPRISVDLQRLGGGLGMSLGASSCWSLWLSVIGGTGLGLQGLPTVTGLKHRRATFQHRSIYCS